MTYAKSNMGEYILSFPAIYLSRGVSNAMIDAHNVPIAPRDRDSHKKELGQAECGTLTMPKTTNALL